MKINEVEALAGITKKNIRFYEEQGLLSPRRNAENGYREYGEEEVRILKQIKLLRKLGVPIEEIRQMLSGIHTLRDGMLRQQVTMEREQKTLEQSMLLCAELQKYDIPLSQLDAQPLLELMETMEQSGTHFQNRQETDIRVQYMAPVVITVLTVVLMTGLIGLLLWAWSTSPEDAPPVGFLLAMIGMFLMIAAGAVIALMQRIKEIQKGEMDDAKYY